MTRSSKLALVTLLAGLFSFVPVSAVSADSGCTGFAREHCEQMADANDAALFRIAAVTTPVHIRSSNGIAREHFEAMSVVQPDRFIIAPSGPAADVSSPVSTPASYMEQFTPRPDQPR